MIRIVRWNFDYNLAKTRILELDRIRYDLVRFEMHDENPDILIDHNSLEQSEIFPV